MANIRDRFGSMTARQKATAAIFIVVLLIIIWQISGLFGRKKAVPAPTAQRTTTTTTMGAAAPGGAPATPAQQRPQPAPLQKQQPMSQREMELLRLQEETQAKYLAAVNELQMLRVERELAETNQAIASARLATVTAQKGIVDMLTPPTPPVVPQEAYSRTLVGSVPTGTPPTTNGQNGGPPNQIPQPPAVQVQADAPYSVISVSQLRYRWYAVLGYQGNLYNVSIGDILPPDGSKVISIDRSGVILQKDGTKRKISLVPII